MDGAEVPYLLILHGSSSRTYVLPGDGNVTVGRSAAVELQIDDQKMSRQHARLTVRQGDVTITDLESQNGTMVNGEPLSGSRLLLTGDLIGMGRATLVLHAGRRAQANLSLLDYHAFRARLADELERARRYERAFACACVDLGKRIDERRVAAAFGRLLGRLDAATWAGDTQLFVLLAEIDAAGARETAALIVASLEEVGAVPRVGLAVYPGDAWGEDALLAAARAAAVVAPPRGVRGSTGCAQRFVVDGRPVIIADPGMSRLYSLIDRLAVVNLPVLICGETGAGKELCARSLHERSERAGKPFVAVNCAALPDTLIESELFGFERGAFSGAVAAKPGLLESAAGGSVFLDEIGELPLATQAKLLRVLELGRLTRLGDLKERQIDVRLLAATNRDLLGDVRDGKFRQDLYFRLAGASLRIPPLRERPAEIAVLAQTFLDEITPRASGRPAMAFTPEAMARLTAHDWPGNVRELKNLVAYVAAAYPGTTVEAWHVVDVLAAGRAPDAPAPAPPPGLAFRPLSDELRELERARIVQALEASGGNQTRAAALLAVPLRTFFDKVRVHGLAPRRAGRRSSDA